MDTLIELIVRGLIALFSGGGDKRRPTPLPPPRQAPAVPPIQQQKPQGRPQPIRKGPIRQAPAARRAPARVALKRKPGPPPVPKKVSLAPAPPRPTMAAKSQAPAPPPTAQPAISAAGIRQLIMSRRSAMRTIYALAEVVGPPLALRDE